MLTLFIAVNNKQGGGELSTVVDTVRNLVTPILDSLHFYLVDLEFVKEGHSWYLRVFIDKQGGIDIEECALVSEQLSEKLDNLDPDPIPQAYFLEVSSPGAERPLKKKLIINVLLVNTFMYHFISHLMVKRFMKVT